MVKEIVTPTESAPTVRNLNLDLYEGLPLGEFVLFLYGGRNCISYSALRCGAVYKDKEVFLDDGQRKVEILIGEQVIGGSVKDTFKACKAEAFEEALKYLQKNCYTIKRNPLGEKVKIEKTDDNQVICNVLKQQEDEKKLDENNKGYKMMKLMGWTGGGLGSLQQGREEPVTYLCKSNRSGLGNNQVSPLNRKYFSQMLENYVKSDDIRELRFEPSFTKEQRAMLHVIANKFNLKSNSYGKDQDRHLIISKKSITNEQILSEVLLRKNPSYCDQYFVQVPVCKASLFPDHTTHLDLNDIL